MKKIWLFVLLLATVPCLARNATSSCPLEGATGLWSREAVYLCPQYKGRDYSRDMRIQSPNQQVTVQIGYDEWSLEVGGRKVSLSLEDSRVAENAELAWAPDGNAFYITQSENRAGVQGFHTEVYRVSNGQLDPLPDVNRIVQAEFDRHHECVFYDRGKQYSEEADIGAVKWVDGSNQILMVAEVPADSDCERDYFAGYLVSLTNGEVVQQYTARELMERWNNVLGDRLKEDLSGLTSKQKDAVP
jgi:hypothetical protein